MRKVLIPHKLLSCQSLVARIHDNRKKTPYGVLSHIFCSLQWLLRFSLERWSLPGYRDATSRNLPVTWACSQVCRSVRVGMMDLSHPAGGRKLSWCPWPKHLDGNTLLHGLELLKASRELPVQCHIYRSGCLWIFHRAATERLLSDLFIFLSHMSCLFIYCTIPMDSSFNVNKILCSSIFSQNLSWYQNTTVSCTGLGEMKQELSLSLV